MTTRQRAALLMLPDDEAAIVKHHSLPSEDMALIDTARTPTTWLAEVCAVASRRALLRMQTWHMREETFRAALACLTDAIHAEPLAAWFGPGHRASADGQA